MIFAFQRWFTLVSVLACISLVGCASKSTTLDSVLNSQNVPEMVILAAGDFQMGINEAIAIKEGLRIYPYEMELPVHKVSVKSFAIAKYDVTNREFAVFAKETGFDPSGCKKYNGHGWVFDAVPQSRST